MSADARKLRERIGGAWSERPGAPWRELRPGEVRAAARVMLDGQARLAALLARLGRDGAGVRLSWHFVAGGDVLALETLLLEGQEAPTLVDLYPGADWAEREARDYYAVAFAGREETPPLMLRPGDVPGILLPEGGRP